MKDELIKMMWPLMPSLTFFEIRQVVDKMMQAGFKEAMFQCSLHNESNAA